MRSVRCSTVLCMHKQRKCMGAMHARCLYASLRFAYVRHVRVCFRAVSVSEVLPRERKAKEEKTVTIGMASVDLIPLLLGENIFGLNACMHL